MAKDKFKKMQEDGSATISSFQTIANTVAAVENKVKESSNPVSSLVQNMSWQDEDPGIVRYMRLSNPQIPIKEYNLVSAYCGAFANMTRQDWVELAIIEKLHNDKQISDDEFISRRNEIRSRPPRGMRRTTKR